MKGLLFKYWDRIRSGFWFLPTVMAAGAVALALACVGVSETLGEWITENLGWKFTGGAEGASAVLGIIAGSMITIAGVVFSMTLVALSLTTSQLGPRLLRFFMRDATTQVVLGTFIATFLYCLVVLRTIRRSDEAAFVPHLAVTLGVLFAVASVGVLIYFIHHVSVSIQANQITAKIRCELVGRLDGLYPGRFGDEPARGLVQGIDHRLFEDIERAGAAIRAKDDGYLQFVDGEALMELATENDVVIRLAHRPGAYVVADMPLARVWPTDRTSEEFADKLRGCFVLGDQRTSDQDLEFGLLQLVEIAVRALSPGLNDPFTAITCVDHLGAVMCRLALVEPPSPHRFDSNDRMRLFAAAPTFTDLLDAAFDQIRHYGASSTAVMIRLMQTMVRIAEFARRPDDRQALVIHAQRIARAARSEPFEDEERRTIERLRDAVLATCAAPIEAAVSAS